MDYIDDFESLRKHLFKFTKTLARIFNDDSSNYYHSEVFHLGGRPLPEPLVSLVRTVICVVKDHQGQLLLVRHPRRGWELCAGHLSREEVEGRLLKEAVHREVLEESGFAIGDPNLVLVGLVKNEEGSLNKELSCPYPQHCLMAIYEAELGEKLSETLYDGIEEVGLFSPDKAKNKVRSRNRAIIEALYP